MKRLILLAAVLLALASVATATTLNVPSQYATIQAAVTAAQTGDVIQVAAGTYTDVTHLVVEGIDSTYCAVIMKSGITVRGAGPTQTFINADSLGRAFHCAGVTNTTIRDLAINRAFANVHGCAIFCRDGSSPTIFNCTISGNFDGGIICINGSSPSVQNCTITNNLSKSGGGILIEDSCSPQVLRTTINNNAAPSGGGIFIRNLSSPSFVDCTIQGNLINALNGSGGGVCLVNSTALLTNCKILSNVADGSGGGLGVFDSSTLTMNGCVVQGNKTLADGANGGGVYSEFSDFTLEDCVVARNELDGWYSEGSAIYVAFAGSPTLHQCTIAANAAMGQPPEAGVISCLAASPTIQQSIIAQNGPGIAIVPLEGSSVPAVSCTDLFGNAGGNGTGWTDAGHNFYLDPLFCDLANNNYRIALNSPCAGGKHPEGAWTCGNTRIGAQDPGCVPASVDDSVAPGDGPRLLGVRPNPFGPYTTVSFEIPIPGQVSLAIFDAAGRLVRDLVNGSYAAGPHTTTWNGADDQGRPLPSGVYFCKMRMDGVERTGQMVLAR
jgi:parallel beta-helix repeat protein